MLLCHLTARWLEKAKNRKINITMFSTSALCLTHHWNIPVSVRVRDRTRPTCPRSKAKWRRRGIKSVSFSTPHTVPSVTLQRRFLYFYEFYRSIVDLQSCVSFRCIVLWISLRALSLSLYIYIYIKSTLLKLFFPYTSLQSIN